MNTTFLRALGWLAPTLLPLLIFVLYPALYSLYLAFHEVDSFSQRVVFTGWNNWSELFLSAAYWESVRSTFVFVLCTAVPSVALGLIIALLLYSRPFFQTLFRTLFLLPIAISSAMAAMLWIFLFNPSAGYLNACLKMLHLPSPNWLGDPHWALGAVALATVWEETGFQVVFLLAGLAQIPHELLEASSLDGANAWQRLRYVILPLLSPALFFVSLVSCISALQNFGPIHILTGGGPANATNVLVYRLYRDAFQNFRTGIASSQATILFILILGITWMQFRVGKSRVHYQ